MYEIIALATAFIAGLAARLAGLPPLVGYLLAGFGLYMAGLENSESLQLFSELGITLLLFTIGLKLDLRSLLMPQIWAVAAGNMLFMVLIGSGLLGLLAWLALPLFTDLDTTAIAVMAFGLSFSSTVFAVKVLEEHGDLKALYGRVAIGVLIMQDIAAVAFLAISTDKVPSPWAAPLLLLIPARHLLHRLLAAAGHGELQILFGLSLALGGAYLFEAVSIKGDLGALILGVLLASSSRAGELAKHLLAFKDLFLVSFFLTIGLNGGVDGVHLLAAVLLLPLVPLKGLLFLVLFTRFHMRARSAFLSSLSLTNFSEFGLIVAVLANQQGLLGTDWTTVLAITLSLSMILAAPINHHSHHLYERWKKLLRKLQRPGRLEEEAPIQPGPAQIIIFGMGRLGMSAYDTLTHKTRDGILGIDQNPEVVEQHVAEGRKVLLGSSADPEFWERIQVNLDELCLVMLTLPTQRENVEAARQLRNIGYSGYIAAIARYPDEVEQLLENGVNLAMNLYVEAGSGFADDVWEHVKPCILARQAPRSDDPGSNPWALPPFRPDRS